MFFHKDPRRVQPLVDHLVHEFESLDFNGESTFAISQVLVFYRAFYEELNWKFTPWIDDMVHRVWGELGCEHDDVSFRKGFSFYFGAYFYNQVRSYIGEILAFADKTKASGII